MSEQTPPPRGGRRRAAPLTPEEEAARERARREGAATGRRSSAAGRHRSPVPVEPEDPWTTSADEPPADVAAADISGVGTVTGDGTLTDTDTDTDDPWLQEPAPQFTPASEPDPWPSDPPRDETPAPPESPAPAATPAPAGTPAAVPTSVATPAPTSRPSVPFRTEIHGLRGLAVLLVVIYHLWLGRVSGGVDVFLFLSAFFLTGTLARRLENGRPLALPAYWARTFQRLFPLGTLVILGALVLAVTILPVTSWPIIQTHALASATYVQNIVLATEAVDYYQHDASSASPLQHFWSLSIQGQVFILWPLLIGLLALCFGLRRRPHAVRRVLGIAFTAILAASLTWSVMETGSHQALAYFDTRARLWEFAAGSLLALALPAIDRRLRARRPGDEGPGGPVVRAVLGWVGVAALLSCGLLLDVQAAFPGWIALWPLGAAALIIVVGHTGLRWGADRVLSTRPMQGLGSISYALYLVHWPLLVGWLALQGTGRAGIVDGLILLVLSVLLAWALTALVDRPLHRSEWFAARLRRSAGLIAACLAVLLLASTAGFSALTHRIIDDTSGPVATPTPTTSTSDGGGATAAPADPERLGAAWRGDPLAAGDAAPLPRPDQRFAPEDLLPEDCTGRFGSADDVHCRYAPAPGTARVRVLLVGDSHSAQYASAAREAATTRGWEVYYVGRPGCSFSTGSGKPECAAVDTIWPRVLDELRPDIVLTVGTTTTADGTPEVARADLPAAVALAQERSIPVLLLRDNPRWAVDEYGCAFEALRVGGGPVEADAACGAPLADKLAAEDPLTAFVDRDPARFVAIADPATDELCPRGRCSPIIGDLYVYRDDDHLTADFSETLGPWLGSQVDGALAVRATSGG